MVRYVYYAGIKEEKDGSLRFFGRGHGEVHNDFKFNPALAQLESRSASEWRLNVNNGGLLLNDNRPSLQVGSSFSSANVTSAEYYYEQWDAVRVIYWKSDA